MDFMGPTLSDYAETPDLVDNPSSGGDKLQEIARLQPAWLTGSQKSVKRCLWPWQGHDFQQFCLRKHSSKRIGNKKAKSRRRYRLRLTRMISNREDSFASATEKHSSFKIRNNKEGKE